MKDWSNDRIFIELLKNVELYADENLSSDTPLDVEGKGCDYIHQKGDKNKLRCNKKTVEGKSRCQFHDHVIFSNDLPQHIQNFCEQINGLLS